jgi:riboflavin transporter FmnP
VECGIAEFNYFLVNTFKRVKASIPSMKTYKLTAIAMLSCVSALFQLSHGVVGIPTGFGMTVDLVGVPILLGFFLFGLDAALYISILAAFVITVASPETWLGASMKFAATVPMFLIPAFYMLSMKKNFDAGKLLTNVFFALFVSLMLFILSINANLAGRSYVPSLSNSTLYTTPRIDYLGFSEIKVTASDLLLGLLPIATIAFFSFILLHLWGRYSKDTTTLVFSGARAMLLVLILSIIVRGIAMIVSNYYFAGPLFFHLSPEQFMALVPWYVIFLWNAFQGAVEVILAWTLAFRFRFIERYARW